MVSLVLLYFNTNLYIPVILLFTLGLVMSYPRRLGYVLVMVSLVLLYFDPNQYITVPLLWVLGLVMVWYYRKRESKTDDSIV